jgi:hypothetical protein
MNTMSGSVRSAAERRAHVRELLEERDHPVVVLEAVQADPRENVLARDEIFVIRLVHVPQQSHLRHEC